MESSLASILVVAVVGFLEGGKYQGRSRWGPTVVMLCILVRVREGVIMRVREGVIMRLREGVIIRLRQGVMMGVLGRSVMGVGGNMRGHGLSGGIERGERYKKDVVWANGPFIARPSGRPTFRFPLSIQNVILAVRLADQLACTACRDEAFSHEIFQVLASQGQIICLRL